MPLTGRPKPGTEVYQKGEDATVDECKVWLAEALADPVLPEDIRKNLEGWLDNDFSPRPQGTEFLKK